MKTHVCTMSNLFSHKVGSDLFLSLFEHMNCTFSHLQCIFFNLFLFLFLNYIAATRYDHYSDVQLITGGGRPHTYEYRNIRKYG